LVTLLWRQRTEATNTVNQLKSDFLKQHQEDLKKSREVITVATAKSFLTALKHQPDPDITKEKGLKSSLLVLDLNTDLPMHDLPTQNALFAGNSKHYFPNKTYNESKTQRAIGEAFKGTYDY